MVSEQISPVQVTYSFMPLVAPPDVDGSYVGQADPHASRLTAALLGQPLVYYGERRVAFRSKRVLALLVFLALTDLGQARERLAALFWPDHDELTARKLLRNLVVLLRHNVADTIQMAYDDVSLVSAEHDALGRAALRIDTAGIPGLTLDTQTIEQAAALARRLVHAHLKVPKDQIRNAIDVLRAAVDLYRGPFLEDVTFDDAPDLDAWIGQQQAFYQQQVEVILNALTALYMESGAIVDASRVAQRWLEVNPYEEAATRYLMQARAAQGDRTGALAVFAATKRLLRTQLDTEPAPETVALAERLRHSIRVTPSKTTAAVSRHVMQQPPVPRSNSSHDETRISFVGRSSEYTELVGAYETARHGQSQILVLEGEAGIGKTRLAEEFLSWAETAGAVVLHAQALEMIGHLAYQPLVDALRPQIAQENAPDDLLADTWLAEMTRLLPELHDRYPDLPTPSAISDDETTARGRLFEAVTQLIHTLAARADTGGLVLFIDNAQWMDTATLDVLQYALHHWAEQGSAVLVLLGVRLEARALEPQLDRWLVSLEREMALRRLVLQPLSFEETHQLLTGLGDWVILPAADHDDLSSQPELLIEWLFRRTGGQPFYLLEMVRTLIDRGVIRCEQTREGQPVVAVAMAINPSSLARMVPGSVRDLIRIRIAQVGDTASDILVAVSVLGNAASFDQLRALAAVSERETLLALDELIRRRLLVLSPKQDSTTTLGSHTSRYMFPHELLGATVYTEAGEDRRRILHARAFHLLVALEPQLGDVAARKISAISAAHAAETAHHALMADMLEPAFRYSLAAADAAMGTLGADNANALYEQALHIAHDLRRLAQASGRQCSVRDAEIKRISTRVGHAYG
jgi:DNA-binding SARP family transcriptional activator